MAIWRSLSGRLLLLTILFVMLAEVMIFVPSVARFRRDYLAERLDKGQLAGLAAVAAGAEPLTRELEDELLRNAEVYSVVLKRDQSRELMLMAPIPDAIGATIDLRQDSVWKLIGDALARALSPEPRYVRVIGEPRLGMGQQVEVVVDAMKLRVAMLDYGYRIFLLSLLISIITAGLVFLSVSTFVVRPMRRVIEGVTSFRENPSDPARLITESGTGGEIGEAERELAAMQHELRAALNQKSRLAALGEAVAKINHDLRNILASAQLLADRLETSRDPLVARVGPKLIGSLDRAIRLCRHTLTYGAAEEPPPEKRPVALEPLLNEVGEALGLKDVDPEMALDGAGSERARAEAPATTRAALRSNAAATAAPIFEVDAPDDLMADADPDQLFRAVLNLARNAHQALESMGGERGHPGRLLIEARGCAIGVEIDVVDDGPGLPPKAREHLFEPFKGSARRGGAGLGLAIAREIAQGHGGTLQLVETGPEGTRFRLVLPAGLSGGAGRKGDARLEEAPDATAPRSIPTVEGAP